MPDADAPVPAAHDRARTPLCRANRERVEPAYRLVAHLLAPILSLATRRAWDDAATLPRHGGVIVCPNHLSNADPPLVAHYLIWSGRWPRFLAKASLFDAPVIGRLVRAIGQIPVARGSRRAASALDAAQDALRAGRCLVVYPEGTVTHDPGQWPMTGHPGAARLALATGAPVLPLGQWGAHTIFDRWHVGRPRLVPRPVIAIALGDPVDLDDLRPDPGQPPTPDAVAAATRRITAATVALVEQLRGEAAPPERFDMRRDWAPGFRADGHPNEA